MSHYMNIHPMGAG